MDERTASRDRHHLHLLSVFHFVAAGLAGLWAFGYWAMTGLMHDNFTAFRSIAEEATRKSGEPSPPPIPWDAFERMQQTIMTGVVVLAVVALVICLVNGVLLRRRRGRVATMVLAGATCLWMPFGTVLGIFTILVLCRPSVVEMYRAGAAGELGGEP